MRRIELRWVVPSELPYLDLGGKRGFADGEIKVQAAKMSVQDNSLWYGRVGKRRLGLRADRRLNERQ
jgi:hypothetical protein